METKNKSCEISKKRIYHPYWLWEDYKAGFYENCSGDIKKQLILKGIYMFNSENLTIDNMLKVINEWKYSCEHNLTNDSMNKIAYIGQSACCIYSKIPNKVTMEIWNKLNKDVQERSNSIALEILNIWKQKHELCQKLD